MIGAIDSQGRPWASLLIGRPGFIEAPDSSTLRIITPRVFGDPLNEHLSIGSDLGLLGIEYQSRRRNRLSGQVIEITDESIALAIEQTIGNCPQYIQSRDYDLLPGIEAIGELDARGPESNVLELLANNRLPNGQTILVKGASHDMSSVLDEEGAALFAQAIVDFLNSDPVTITEIDANFRFVTTPPDN